MTAVTDTARRRAATRQPAAYVAPGLTLRGALGIFAGRLNARLIAGLLLASAAARLALARWSWGDLEVAGAILVLQPFTEWFTHVLVLHLKPIRIGSRTFDPIVARRHREHHRDPKIIELVLIPRGVLARLLVFAVPVFYLVTPTLAEAASALVTGYGMLLLYEWTHFLIHSSYVPKSWYYRSIWRAHRLHHFRNERYWFGVTVNTADHVFRTFPARDAVPASPTARTLGVELPP